jgi:hypothetical protein
MTAPDLYDRLISKNWTKEKPGRKYIVTLGMKKRSKEAQRRRKKVWILEVHEGKAWNVRVSKKMIKFMQVRDGETRKSGKITAVG